MIRQAVRTDWRDVVRMAGDWHAAANFGALLGVSPAFDPDHAQRGFLSHLGPRRCAIVHDVEGRAQGVLLAAACQHPLGPALIAQETIWWIDPAHRGRAAFQMLDAYEAWAKAAGCVIAGMVTLAHSPDVARLLKRRGYRVAEMHYFKAI